MRLHQRCLIFLLCLSLLPLTAFAREGDSDAVGKITQVDNGVFEIIVKGRTEKGPLWLGCTFYPGTKRETDLEAVSSGKKHFLASGNFAERFRVPTDMVRWAIETSRGNSEADYVVALWRWRVEKSECRKRSNGGPCEYCLKNGYHLEDRVDIGRGTWSFETKGTSREELRKGQREVEARENRDRIERENREKANADEQRRAAPQRLPPWAQQVTANPIVPGRGLAGLQIGQSVDDVIAKLGEPSGGISPTRSTSGELIQYSMGYKHGGLFLGVYLTPDSKRVKSFRLYDTDFNRSGVLPSLSNGITIGSDKVELFRGMGSPKSTDAHNTGPENHGNRRATSLPYPGIEFCVPDANGKVYWIDIP